MQNAKKSISMTILPKAEQNEGNTNQINKHKCEPSEGGNLKVGLEGCAIIARHFLH
jgi:hypothetical protein